MRDGAWSRTADLHVCVCAVDAGVGRARMIMHGALTCDDAVTRRLVMILMSSWLEGLIPRTVSE